MGDPAELIRSFCRDGNAAAFREFYRAQAPRLWKFLVARGCAPEDAYDLLSESFLRFVARVCRDPRAPVAFLYRIATNLRVDAWRRVQASPVNAAMDADSVETAGEPPPDEAAQVREWVASLPPREQNLLLMRYWIGLSHRELAHALDLPEGTVRRQCAEVLEKLRQRLGES